MLLNLQAATHLHMEELQQPAKTFLLAHDLATKAKQAHLHPLPVPLNYQQHLPSLHN